MTLPPTLSHEDKQNELAISRIKRILANHHDELTEDDLQYASDVLTRHRKGQAKYNYAIAAQGLDRRLAKNRERRESLRIAEVQREKLAEELDANEFCRAFVEMKRKEREKANNKKAVDPLLLEHLTAHE